MAAAQQTRKETQGATSSLLRIPAAASEVTQLASKAPTEYIQVGNAHQVILLHSCAVALFTAEPAVLWLCRYQNGKDAVRHFQKQAKNNILCRLCIVDRF